MKCYHCLFDVQLLHKRANVYSHHGLSVPYTTVSIQVLPYLFGSTHNPYRDCLSPKKLMLPDLTARERCHPRMVHVPT